MPGDANISVDDLQPFQSFIVAKWEEVDGSDDAATKLKSCIRQIRDEDSDDRFVDEYPDQPAKGKTRKIEGRQVQDSTDSDGLLSAFLLYSLTRPVDWVEGVEIQDVENHLILLSWKADTSLVSIYASEKVQRRWIRRRLGSGDSTGLGQLSMVPADRLQAAFIGDELRALWLSGMHRRVPVKADAKMLTGIDVELALDPLGDQTFVYSAARSEVDEQDFDASVGLSPEKSLIWKSQSGDWETYAQDVSTMLRMVDGVGRGESKPISNLTYPAESIDDVSDPYEMVVRPPISVQSDHGSGDDSGERELFEKWAYDASFPVENSDSWGFTTEVTVRGKEIGEMQVSISADGPHDVSVEEVEFSGDAEDDSIEELRDEITRICGRRQQVKVYYDSGHTLAGNTVYLDEFDDVPFEKWVWRDFSGKYNVGVEKPLHIQDSGNDGPWNGEQEYRDAENPDTYSGHASLFRWVYDKWLDREMPWLENPTDEDSENDEMGWLVCDDGAGETADLIHVQHAGDDSARTRLTLIHIKASGSTSENRRISVADYERVTAQAEKNARYLKRGGNLARRLKERTSAFDGDYVWCDGKEDSLDSFHDAVDDIDDRRRLRVAVVQPRIRRPYWEKVRKGSDDAAALEQNQRRLKKLNLLMNATENTMDALGAEFCVISSED